MKTSRVLSAISFAIVMGTPACTGNFVPLGNDDAGAAGNHSSVGGATSVTCLYNNVVYPAGSSFKSTDGCNTCGCASDGQVACTLMACAAVGGNSGAGGSTSVTCLYDGVNYAAGTSFRSTDGCNTCGCTSTGQVACTAMACAAVGGSSGVGGSTGTDCTCTGPAPGAPTVQCWDGSIGGPVCEKSSAGTCGWTVRSCPPQPGTGGASGAGGSTGISSCSTAADCKGAVPALCEQCADGSNGCAHFVCNSGSCQIAYCDTISCLYSGVYYVANSSFKATDGCNTCSCTSTGVACTKMACNAPGTGGSTSVGGAGAGGGTSCPAIKMIMPKCDNSTAIMKYDPATGCADGYVCPTCDAVGFANISCANYQLVTDPTTGCPIGVTCPTVDASTCPPIALVIPVCTNGSAGLKYDPSTGCATGYACP
jgi:hypothetical protein